MATCRRYIIQLAQEHVEFRLPVCIIFTGHVEISLYFYSVQYLVHIIRDLSGSHIKYKKAYIIARLPGLFVNPRPIIHTRTSVKSTRTSVNLHPHQLEPRSIDASATAGCRPQLPAAAHLLWPSAVSQGGPDADGVYRKEEAICPAAGWIG